MSVAADIKAMPAAERWAGVGAYVELTKARLAMLVLVTTAVGFFVGHDRPMTARSFLLLAHLIAGTGLLAAGAMTLNQYLERGTDALMHRTMKRPLPSGRIAPVDALAFGTLLSIGGLLYLLLLVNALTAALGGLTIASYLFAYTPLKSRTTLCTIVGAVPGALPPMMGYAAARHAVDERAWALFAILFVWQMPHFLAIGWLYREDYARGRQMMLPVLDPSGRATARQMLVFSLTLLPVTLAPTLIGMAGVGYFIGAAVLGIAFFAFAAMLAAARTTAAARQMFLVSVVYLPLLLGLMVVDRVSA